MRWMPFQNRAALTLRHIASGTVSLSASSTMAVVFPRRFVTVSSSRSSPRSQWDKAQDWGWTSFGASSGTTRRKSLWNPNPDARNFVWSCPSPTLMHRQERILWTGGLGHGPGVEKPRGFTGHDYQRPAYAWNAGWRSSGSVARVLSAGAAYLAHS